MSAIDNVKRNKIISLVSIGCSQVVAARMANCTLAEVQATLNADPELLQELANAEGQLEVRALQALDDAGTKNWRAACWLLERLYPERYGRRSADAVTISDLIAFLSRVSGKVFHHVNNGVDRDNLLKAISELGRELQTRERRLPK